MKTISLVEMLTALTQLMAEKVNAGDNTEVPICVDAEFTYTQPIKELKLIHSDDGRLLKIIIKAGMQ